MLILEKVTVDNLKTAIQIQEEIFPGESGRRNFEEAVSGETDYTYWLLLDDNNPVGIIGLYTYEEDPESAWLGWFGIRREFRRRHLGTAAIRRFEEIAAQRHFRYARLYTDANDNETAIAFYRSNGYTEEIYENPDDPASLQYRMLIFSKTLSDEPLKPWNSRSIHLTRQIAKQEEGNMAGRKDTDDGTV